MCERQRAAAGAGALARVPVFPAGRQRRPSGAPPPLPRHIERSGLIWLAAAIVATGAAIAVFADGLSRWAVDVTVVDDAITRRVASVPVPGFTAVARVIAAAGAAPATVIAGYMLLLALVVLRRFRHLLVLVVSYEALTVLTTIFLLIVHRPLLFGAGPVSLGWLRDAVSRDREGMRRADRRAVRAGTRWPVAASRRLGRGCDCRRVGLSRMRLGVAAPDPCCSARSSA